jgi:hypothetical protein
VGDEQIETRSGGAHLGDDFGEEVEGEGVLLFVAGFLTRRASISGGAEKAKTMGDALARRGLEGDFCGLEGVF